ncbi:MAG TPA: response regulator [Actinomycetota bacterium]
MARLLVIDAATPIRALTRRTLAMDGHEVVDVGTAEDVFKALLNDRTFDLILLDVDLADRDGYDMLEDIRRLPAGATTPVIVLTSDLSVEALEIEERLDVIARVVKPFGFGDLKLAVNSVVEPAAQEASLRRTVSLEDDSKVAM